MISKKEILKKYPRFFDYLKEEKGPRSPMIFGIECRNGWLDLVDHTLGCIYQYSVRQEAMHEEFKFPRIKQIKEKFGGLEIYIEDGDLYMFGMVSLSSYISRRTCEFCGTQRNVGRTHGGWVYTSCELCQEKNERAKDLEWIPND